MPPEDGTAGSEVMALLLADARLPTGNHTQSGGLEIALLRGMPLIQVPEYLRGRLAGVTLVEAAVAVAARHVAGYADPRAALAAVDGAWRARTVSPALRENSAVLARGYLRLVAAIWPSHSALPALSSIPRVCRPTVMGAAAAAAGLSARQLARLVAYDDVQTVCAAALKLAPMDPLTGVGWVVEMAPDIDALVDAVVSTTTAADIPAWSAPQTEQWAQLHAGLPRRLFRA